MAERGMTSVRSIELPSRIGNDVSTHSGYRIELRLLGRFELVDSRTGNELSIPSRKTKALLALLATAPRFTMSRSRLASLLWSGSAEEQARQSLRQMLSNLRRAPQPIPLAISDDDTDVRLDDATVRIDVAAIQSTSQDASLSELASAVAAYRGALGVDLELGEADFDSWLQTERERIDGLAIPLMDRLIRALADAGRHQEALEKATALLAINPLREETHRLVITQEAIVSGRASAMQRFESFRIQLRDDLAVRPEPATIRLIDQLRNLPIAAPKPAPIDPPAAPATTPTPTTSIELPQHSTQDVSPATSQRSWWRFAAASVAVCVCVALTIAIALNIRGTSEATRFAGETDGRASVTVLPFDGVANDDASKALRSRLYRETTLSFSRNNRLSLVDLADKANRSTSDLSARYLVKTSFSERDSRVLADVTLVDTASGVSLWSAPIPASDEPIKFARQLFGFVFSEITLNQARRLSKIDRDSTEAMIWRATASQIQTRLGAEDRTAVDLYRAILAREPNHFFALLGLANYYILRVARNQSDDRKTEIAAAAELLLRAKPQAPNSVEIVFAEGMINKLTGDFERSAFHFLRAMQLDPTHWNAAAQYAHMQMFLGHPQKAYELMQQATQYLLPDMRAAETAYIAGEVALVAGHPDEAVRYLTLAVNGNPTIGRNHAMLAGALQMAGRSAEAKASANRARELSPNYTPKVMAMRGGPSASSFFIEARDRIADAYRIALEAPIANASSNADR